MKNKKIKDVDVDVIEDSKEENKVVNDIESIKDNLIADENIIRKVKKEKKVRNKKNSIDVSTSRILAGFPIKILNLAFTHFSVSKITKEEETDFINAFSEAITSLPANIIEYFDKWGGMLGLILVTGLIIQPRIQEHQDKLKKEKQEKKEGKVVNESDKNLDKDKDLQDYGK